MASVLQNISHHYLFLIFQADCFLYCFFIAILFWLLLFFVLYMNAKSGWVFSLYQLHGDRKILSSYFDLLTNPPSGHGETFSTLPSWPNLSLFRFKCVHILVWPYLFITVFSYLFISQSVHGLYKYLSLFISCICEMSLYSLKNNKDKASFNFVNNK